MLRSNSNEVGKPMLVNNLTRKKNCKVTQIRISKFI